MTIKFQLHEYKCNIFIIFVFYSDTSKSEHAPARQKENFHLDLKSVKNTWKQRESKKEETKSSTTPPPKKLSLTHKGFPFNKDMNEAAHTTQDECNKQAPAARPTSDSSEIKTEDSREKNSHEEKNRKSETNMSDENKIEQNKHENQGEAPDKVHEQNKDENQGEAPDKFQTDSNIDIGSVNKHDTDIQDDTSQAELNGASENKDVPSGNKSDQLDSNVEEEPVVDWRKSRNVNGTNERKTLDGNHHKSQGLTANTTGDTTSVTPFSVAVGAVSDKTSSVIDGASAGKTKSDEGNGTSNDVTAEETTTEESKINVHETANFDVSMETTQKTLNHATENEKEPSDNKVELRKSSSGSSKEHLNALGTSNVSMVTARKTFPYTAETQGNQPDEDAVVLRPKSTSSRLASRSKSSSQKSTSDSSNPNGVAVASKEEEKVITKPEKGETQKVNGESDNNLQEEDNPLFKVCKTEEIPSLNVMKSEEMTAWEELRNYLTSNFGPLNSLINGETSEDRTKEDDNPVLALKEYLNNFS